MFNSKNIVKYAITISLTFMVFLILKSVIANIGGMPESFTKIYDESIFVKTGVFNAAISLYMMIIFIHLISVYVKLQKHIKVVPIIRGIVYGTSFGILWFFGFLELVIIYSSKISTHIGSGVRDLLSLSFFGFIVGLLFTEKEMTLKREKLLVVPIVSLSFGLFHWLQYNFTFSGIVQRIENVGGLAWLLCTGGWIGFMYSLYSTNTQNILRKAFAFSFVVFGINWVLYTSFYVLFLDIPMIDLVIRCSCDLFGVFIGVLTYEFITLKIGKSIKASPN